MKRNFIAATFAIVGLGLVAGLASAPSAKAERVYDYASMKWVNVDPNKRKYTRKAPPKKFARRVVSINTREKPGTVIIHTDEKYLYLVQGGGRAIRYGVGVGREGFTWAANNLVIQRKAEWPAWTPPPEMVAREAAQGHKVGYMPGGEDNPLGARAMYLYKNGRDTQYRIHGTNQPWSIGLNLSSGCIRMMNKDVEDLYSRVPVGSKVIVIGEGEDARKYFGETWNPLAFVPRPRFMTRKQTETASAPAQSAPAKKAATNSAKPQSQFGMWKSYWKQRFGFAKASAE